MNVREDLWDVPGTRRRLAYQLWWPAGATRLLVVLHGYGEHSGRYASVAETLSRDGVGVLAPDHVGHGRSSGARGDIESVSRVVEDETALVCAHILPTLGVREYSVFGHSFGGLAGIVWAMRQPAGMRRLIVQSPLLQVGFPLPSQKLAAARVLRRWWPTCSVAMDLDAAALSHDADIVRAYQQDPLVHNRMSVRSYFSLLEASDAALAAPEQVRVPVLMLLAGQDRIVSLPVARQWFDLLPGEKSFRMFDGAYHELHHEPVRDQALAAAVQWLAA